MENGHLRLTLSGAGATRSLPRERAPGGVAQLVRAPACHAGGRGFEPRHSRHLAWSRTHPGSRSDGQPPLRISADPLLHRHRGGVGDHHRRRLVHRARQRPDVEKLSPYECGFEPFGDARGKFDVRFYLVAILFIIFDLEVAFLFPWAVALGNIGLFGFWSMMGFLGVLTVGFIYEWKKGSVRMGVIDPPARPIRQARAGCCCVSWARRCRTRALSSPSSISS